MSAQISRWTNVLQGIDGMWEHRTGAEGGSAEEHQGERVQIEKRSQLGKALWSDHNGVQILDSRNLPWAISYLVPNRQNEMGIIIVAALWGSIVNTEYRQCEISPLLWLLPTRKAERLKQNSRALEINFSHFAILFGPDSVHKVEILENSVF